MNAATPSEQAAIAACEALCHAHGAHADHADAFAALYTPDGVFERMGQRFVGRAAIRGGMPARPPASGPVTAAPPSHTRWPPMDAAPAASVL